MLAEMGLADKDISFEAVLNAVSRVKMASGSFQGAKDSNKIVLHGHSNEHTTHSINVDEMESFTLHLNQALANDKDVKSRLPIDPKSMNLFPECRGTLRTNTF